MTVHDRVCRQIGSVPPRGKGPDGEPDLQAGVDRPAVDRPSEPRPGRGQDRGPGGLRGGPGHLQPPPPAEAPEVRRAAHVRAPWRRRAHLRDVPPRARHPAHPRRARRPAHRPPRSAHPRRRVLRDGPHRTPPAHRRAAVHGEDPRRRRRTPARPPARTDLRRAAGRRGQGQQGRPPPGRPGREDQRRARRVPGRPVHRRPGPRTRRQPLGHPYGRRRPHARARS